MGVCRPYVGGRARVWFVPTPTRG